MIKKVLPLVLVLLGLQAIPTQASSVESIAVIDSGTNVSLFKNNIVYEVCLVSESTCPNGKHFMEGDGAANIPISNNDVLEHGTRILSIITQVNPNAKIVLIRIVGIDLNKKPTSYYTEDIDKALAWIVKNQKKYNISVVNISQGNTFSSCDVSVTFKNQVSFLKKLNVPVIAASGNDGNNKPVFTPACWKDVVAVGSTDFFGTVKSYTNLVGKVDFYLPDEYTVTTLDNKTKKTIGTSNATAALSSLWLLNKQSNYDRTYAFLKNWLTKKGT